MTPETEMNGLTPRAKAAARLRAVLVRTRRNHGSALLYAASSLIKTGAGFVVSLVTVRLVSPADLGLWNSASLATTYSALLQAGVVNGLNRELPEALGREDNEKAKRLAGTALAVSLAACFAALALGGCALICFGGRGPALIQVICAATLMVPITLYQSYLITTFRSKSSFRALGKTDLLGAALGLLLLPLICMFRFEGMLIRLVVVSLLAVVLLHAIRPIRVKPQWDGPSLKLLLNTGLPIFVLAYIQSTCSTFDRVLLIDRGGIVLVGYYSLGMLAQQAMLVVPGALAAYVYPRMTYALAKDGSLEGLWGRAWKATIAVLGLMLPVAIGAAMAISYLVTPLFPKYSPGIRAAQILVFAAVLSGAALGVNALWSMKAWKHMVAYQIGGAGLRGLGPFIGVTLNRDPLSGVAWGMLGAYGAQLALGIVLTRHATYRGARASADEIETNSSERRNAE